MANRAGDAGAVVERIGARLPGWRVIAADLGGALPAAAHVRHRLLMVDPAPARRHWRAVARLVYRLAA